VVTAGVVVVDEGPGLPGAGVVVVVDVVGAWVPAPVVPVVVEGATVSHRLWTSVPGEHVAPDRDLPGDEEGATVSHRLGSFVPGAHVPPAPGVPLVPDVPLVPEAVPPAPDLAPGAAGTVSQRLGSFVPDGHLVWIVVVVGAGVVCVDARVVSVLVVAAAAVAKGTAAADDSIAATAHAKRSARPLPLDITAPIMPKPLEPITGRYGLFTEQSRLADD
jgi:hypothetical protein